MRTAIAAVMLMALTACVSNTRNDSDSPYVRGQILDATAAWAAAYDSRDPKRITALYAPEAALWGTTAKSIANTPELIAEYFKDAGKTPDNRVEFGPQNIHIWGDFATNSGYYSFKSVQGGKPVVVPARYTMVFQRRAGVWVLVEHHSSRVP